MIKNRNLFKFFLALGAIPIARLFFMNVSATDCNPVYGSYSNSNISFDSFRKSDECRIFSRYKLPVEFNKNAKPLANKVVIAYFLDRIFDCIAQKNPFICEFLKSKVTYPESYIPKNLLLTMKDNIMTGFGDGLFLDFFDFEDATSKEICVYYSSSYSQPHNVIIHTNKVIINEIGKIFKNSEELKKILESINNPNNVKEYAKSIVIRWLKSEKLWNEYYRNITLESCIESVKGNIKKDIRCYKEDLTKNLASKDSYKKYIERRLKEAEDIKCEDYECDDFYAQLLEVLNNFKANIKNVDENKKLLDKINSEIKQIEDEGKDSSKNALVNFKRGIKKWADKYREILKDDKVLEENYNKEKEERCKDIKEFESLLNDDKAIKEKAQKDYKRLKNISNRSTNEHTAVEGQLKDIENLKDEDIYVAIEGMKIGSEIELKSFGEIPFYM